MTRTEDQIQRSMVQWMEMCVVPPPIGPFWTAVNPAPSKTIATAGRSKMLGMKAGTPDLIMCWKGKFIGVEVKPPFKYLSKVQKEAHRAITLTGGVVTTVHSVDELQAFLLALGVPIKGRVAA